MDWGTAQLKHIAQVRTWPRRKFTIIGMTRIFTISPHQVVALPTHSKDASEVHAKDIKITTHYMEKMSKAVKLNHQAEGADPSDDFTPDAGSQETKRSRAAGETRSPSKKQKGGTPAAPTARGTFFGHTEEEIAAALVYYNDDE
jgi:hypothetical protein